MSWEVAKPSAVRGTLSLLSGSSVGEFGHGHVPDGPLVIETERLTVPVNPLMLVTFIVDPTVPPGGAMSRVPFGTEARPKSGTTTMIFVKTLYALAPTVEVVFTTIAYLPVGVADEVVIDTVALPETTEVDKVTLGTSTEKVGRALTVVFPNVVAFMETTPAKPLMLVSVNVDI